jgi:hypothetical protein
MGLSAFGQPPRIRFVRSEAISSFGKFSTFRSTLERKVWQEIANQLGDNALKMWLERDAHLHERH